MSTVFSRRAFLKYTAVAAVAVAGTSLLGGCSGAETAICNDVGENASNTVLQIKSTLTALDFSEMGTVVFHLHVKNGRYNPVQVGNSNFFVYADEKLYQGTNSIKFSLQPGSASGTNIQRGKEADFLIQIDNVPTDVNQLALTFIPDTQYNEYTANWILPREKFISSGETENPDETTGA